MSPVFIQGGLATLSVNGVEIGPCTGWRHTADEEAVTIPVAPGRWSATISCTFHSPRLAGRRPKGEPRSQWWRLPRGYRSRMTNLEAAFRRGIRWTP